MGKNRSLALDIIRIFACLCILIIHFDASVCGWETTGGFTYPNQLIPNNILGGIYLGDFGVGLFFIISGACLQLSSRFNSLNFHEIIHFYKKRALSIYPCYWIAFFFATLISFLWYKGMTMGKVSKLLISFCGLDGYAGFMLGRGGDFYQVGEWFLGCIIIIYLLFPFISYTFHKMPVLTCIFWGGLHLLLINSMSKHWFFLVIPYFLLGMVFVKFCKTAKNPILLFTTVVAVLVRIIFEQYVPYPTKIIIISWGMFVFLFLITEFLEEMIPAFRNELLKKYISYISVLTYPAFLIHHKLISMLAPTFNLANFPYRYTVVLFICYMIIVGYLAIKLDKAAGFLALKIKSI